MKKVKLLCLSILGLLFLIPLVNFSTAAPGDYVGVEEGDSFSWKLSMNVDAITALVEDAGGTLNLSELEGFEDMAQLGSLTFMATVNDVLAETTMTVNFVSVTYVPVNATFSASIPGLGTEEIGSLIVPVFSNETDYYIHTMFYYFTTITMSDEGPSFMFAAQNLNWTKAVEDVLEKYDLNPMYDIFIVTEESNGFKLVIPEGELNVTQKEIEFRMTYNDKGVLSYAGFKYDGATAMSLTLGGDAGEIPGYVLPIFMGTIAVVGIGLIYVIKKRNRF